MKDNNQKLIEVLKKAIGTANQMWDSKSHSDAYIIGWLQGTIKGVISELEINNEMRVR